MELKYMTTPEQYKKCVRDLTKQKFLKMSITETAVISALAFIFMILGNYGWIAYLALLVLAILFCAFFFFTLRSNQNMAIQKSIHNYGEGYFNHPKTITLTAEKLEFESTIRSIAAPYRGIEKITEDSLRFFIKFKAGDSLYIPKAGILNPENTQEFIAFLNSKLN